jgi:hypothetical protein
VNVGGVQEAEFGHDGKHAARGGLMLRAISFLVNCKWYESGTRRQSTTGSGFSDASGIVCEH